MKHTLKTVWKKAQKLDIDSWNRMVDELDGFTKELQEEISAFRGWLRVYRTELSDIALSDYKDHLAKLEALGETEEG